MRSRVTKGLRGWATLPVLCLLGGVLLCFSAGWIHVKAGLASVLLHAAWRRTVSTHTPVRPWPWADTRPVARLRVPAHDKDLIVLEGQSGAVLAFGPGLLRAGAAPGKAGICMLAGHRDTSFRFLQRVCPGDLLILEDTAGVSWRYRVYSTTIIRAEDLYLEQSEQAMLALVTCYPFQAVVPGSRLRFMVLAERIRSQDGETGLRGKSAESVNLRQDV